MSDLSRILESSSNTNGSKKPNKIPKPALVALTAAGGVAVGITLVSIPFLSPGFRKICLPYVPATSSQIVNVLKALKHRSGTVVDLGSGDGRIVRAAAAYGFKSVGVEINFWLYVYSRLLSLFKGYSTNTTFYWKDLWSFDLKPFSNVIVFGTEPMMPLVEKKCRQELNHGSIVVACRFPFSTLKPIKIIGEGVDTVWMYNIVKM